MTLQILAGMEMWKVDIDQISKGSSEIVNVWGEEVQDPNEGCAVGWAARTEAVDNTTAAQQLLHSFGNQELEPDSEDADPVVSDAALYAVVDVDCSADSDDQGDFLYPARQKASSHYIFYC